MYINPALAAKTWVSREYLIMPSLSKTLRSYFNPHFSDTSLALRLIRMTCTWGISETVRSVLIMPCLSKTLRSYFELHPNEASVGLRFIRMTCTWVPPEREVGQLGALSYHALSVKDIEELFRTLRCPWGISESIRSVFSCPVSQNHRGVISNPACMRLQ